MRVKVKKLLEIRHMCISQRKRFSKVIKSLKSSLVMLEYDLCLKNHGFMVKYQLSMSKKDLIGDSFIKALMKGFQSS